MGQVVTAIPGLWAERFAPAAGLKLDDDFAVAGLRGFAFPDSGEKPCLLTLSVDGILHALAAASGFSVHAAASGTRFGWCGFDLGIVEPRKICGDVEIRCAVSDRVLIGWTRDAVPWLHTVPARPHLTALELAKRAEEIGSCTDVRQIYPFADDFRARFGDRRFVTAVYRYVLGRATGVDELNDFLSRSTAGRGLDVLFQSFTSSEEFARTRRFPLPGVFATGFEFGTTLLSRVNNG